MKLKLKVIIGSTRPGRKGPAVADWFMTKVAEHTEFDVELIDLKEINLPFMDEAAHPRAQKYTNDHTKKWQQTIDSADAYVIVTPEYNYSYPATLKNALDYLALEWCEKPMGFVSYGGLSGGTRAVQELKGPVTTLGMMPLPEAVNIPFFAKHINDNGEFESYDSAERSAEVMLKKLKRWAKALKRMREEELA